MSNPFFGFVAPSPVATVSVFVRCTRCKGKYIHHLHPTRAYGLGVEEGGWLQVDVCADCLTSAEASGSWLRFSLAPCQPVG